MQTLRLFYDVARCHSFSQAATAHGITQSAASQRIGQLERRLGVTLIDRSVRPLDLTEAGRVFLAGVEDLLDRYDRLEQQVSRLTDRKPGLVRVEAIYSAGLELLQHIREQFEAEFSGISIEIHYKKPEDVYQAVRDGHCDMGIVSYPQRWTRVNHLPLRNELMVVVARPGHPLTQQTRLHARALTDRSMVTFEMDLRVGRRIRAYLRDQGATPRIVDSFDNIDTIKNVVAVTDHFAILPKRTVLRELAAGTLATIELEPMLVRPIGIIYPRKRYGSDAAADKPFAPAAQQFVDYLIRHAGPDVDVVGQRTAVAMSGTSGQASVVSSQQ